MCQCKKRDKYEVCPDCTLSTKYLVFDGKFVGPNKHAIDHLDEEDHEDDDGLEGHEDTLTQSTLFKNARKSIQRCASITCKTCKIYCYDC